MLKRRDLRRKVFFTHTPMRHLILPLLLVGVALGVIKGTDWDNLSPVAWVMATFIFCAVLFRANA